MALEIPINDVDMAPSVESCFDTSGKNMDGTPDLTCGGVSPIAMNKTSPLSLLHSEPQNKKMFHEKVIQKPCHEKEEKRDDESCSLVAVVVETKDASPRDATTSNKRSQEEEPNHASTTEISKEPPNYLEEATLERLKEHVKETSGLMEVLNEDEIERKMVQTNRIVAEQTRHVLADPSEDSEEESGQQGPQASYRQQEEQYVLAEHLFKQTVSACQAKNTLHVLAKKSLSWLRGAMGISREKAEHYDGLRLEPRRQDAEKTFKESLAEKKDAAPAAAEKPRLTRGRARSTRIKRRQERIARENQGVDALLEAAVELETEIGPSKVQSQNTKVTDKKKSAQTTRRRSRSSSSSERSHESAKRPRRDVDGVSPSTLMTKNGTIVRIKVGGVVLQGPGETDTRVKPNARQGGVQNAASSAVTGYIRQPRRPIPLTDRQFLVWFQGTDEYNRLSAVTNETPVDGASSMV